MTVLEQSEHSAAVMLTQHATHGQPHQQGSSSDDSDDDSDSIRTQLCAEANNANANARQTHHQSKSSKSLLQLPSFIMGHRNKTEKHSTAKGFVFQSREMLPVSEDLEVPVWKAMGYLASSSSISSSSSSASSSTKRKTRPHHHEDLSQRKPHSTKYGASSYQHQQSLDELILPIGPAHYDEDEDDQELDQILRTKQRVLNHLLLQDSKVSLPVITTTERAPLLSEDATSVSSTLAASAPDSMYEFAKLSRLSYPVIMTYMLEYLPGIISMTLVGHMKSPETKEYVDGVSLSMMAVNLTAVAFGFGLATAMDTLCTQAYGAGKPRTMGIYLQTGAIVLGLSMIPIALALWFTEDLLLLMGQPAIVALYAGKFSRIVLPGIPFMFAYELLKKILQAQNIVVPMVYIALLSNLLNIGLGMYLTFYTSFGYIGAAIARTVSSMVLPTALVPYFMVYPEVIDEWWPGWKLKSAMNHLGEFLRLGVPGMWMLMLEWWSFEIMAVFVGLLPNSVVCIAVHTVLVSVSTLIYNVFLGISVAGNIRVGNYMGKNQPNHAKMAAFLTLKLALGVALTISLLVYLFRSYLPGVFINDPVTIEKASKAIILLMVYTSFDALNCAMQGVFRGTGRQTLGAWINLLSYGGVCMPLGLYLAFPWNLCVEGLWVGLTVGYILGCLASFFFIWRTNWKQLAQQARLRSLNAD